MHTEILNHKQLEILEFIRQFKNKFYLVGGTAIALQIGHRQSIDFDLFSEKKFSINTVHKKVELYFPSYKIIYRSSDQIHYLLNEVKVTFFHYPYPIKHSVSFNNILTMPDLLTLSAMKAYALGRRAKWKDYVDLFFLLKNFVSMEELINKAIKIFGAEFSPKLFKQQLIYFQDINYSEDVVFLPSFKVSEEEVKEFLIEIATREF